jgi:hypothetical protein
VCIVVIVFTRFQLALILSFLTLLIMIFLCTFTFHNSFEVEVCFDSSCSISLVVLNFWCLCLLHVLCFGVMQVFIIVAFNFWSVFYAIGVLSFHVLHWVYEN